MNGMQALKAVAAHETLPIRHAYIRLMAVGEVLPLTFRDLLAQLGVPLIKKPFDLPHLLRAVTQANTKLGNEGRRI